MKQRHKFTNMIIIVPVTKLIESVKTTSVQNESTEIPRRE